MCTYPFRSELQLTTGVLWLYVGRDRTKLRRLFRSYKLPLYYAASPLRLYP
jgi:hypothetical protein